MIERGNLSSFNQSRIRDLSECNDEALVSIILTEQTSFPLIYLLLTQTTKFYSQHFAELQDKIKREKRLVVFETPSRVQMTHEYTIEGAGDMKQGFFFLFNATKRLSWLKVYLEGSRISIASKEKIISILKAKLADELEILESFLKEERDIIVRKLYELSDGKPCFVEFNQKEYKGQQSLLLSLTFFDSIQNKELSRCERIMSPLKEKVLTYNYNTLSDKASSWIYFKAPSNFVLSVENHAGPSEIEKSDSNDEEISAFVLTPNGKHLDIRFDISVNVPGALRSWYHTLFYFAITMAVVCLSLSLYSIWKQVPVNFVEKINNASLAVAAALIATRGWLMSEEQVMKSISRWYTGLVVILVIFPMVFSSPAKDRIHSNIDKNENEAKSVVIDTLPKSILNSDNGIVQDGIIENQNIINN